MYTQAVLISVLVAIAEARFGQEQIPISAISAVTSGGNPGEAATLAGASISFLLGAADPCGKLSQADKIIATLGTGADSIAAAKGLVAAEQNFNPTPGALPKFCADASLPATAELRGILPLVDPAVDGSDVANAASAASLNNPVQADGQSIADLLVAAGFTNFVDAPGGNGGAVAAPAAGGNDNADDNADDNNNAGGNNNDNNQSDAAPEATAAPQAPAAPPVVACPTTLVTVTRGAAPAATPAPAAGENNNNNGGNDNNAGNNNAGDNNNGDNNNNTGNDNNADNNNAGNNQNAGGAAGGATDFGTCEPTILFQGGLGGRPQTEFTFQSTDAAIAAGQQEALNPNIITNRICDQLTNICGANAAAKALCLTAKAQILASGARDASVVTAWNSALGF